MYDQLVGFHKRINTAFGPFTLMLARRKLSVKLLERSLDEIEDSCKEIRKFLEKHDD